MIIVGYSGKAEHGKTACCRIMRERAAAMNLKAEIFEISKLIMDHCVRLGLMPAGLTRDELNSDQVKMLVDEGTRMRDTVDPNYWTNKIFEWIDATKTIHIALIPNLRFKQEAQSVIDRNGYVVRVNRLNADGSPFISTTRDPNHPCETSLDKWAADFYITNKTGRSLWLERVAAVLLDHILELDLEGASK